MTQSRMVEDLIGINAKPFACFVLGFMAGLVVMAMATP